MRDDGHRLSMVGLCGLLLALMASCTATVTALKHTDLEVQTRVSEPIFLDPVAPAQQSVWLELKSTADQPVELAALREVLTTHGYRVVTDPDQAHYRFQVHVLYVGKAVPAAIDQTLGVGYGGPLAGVLGGATKVNLRFEDARPALEQGLVRSLAGLL